MPSFSVSAIWDEEAQVYYSESDIVGLHLEAATIEEFESEMKRLAPELIMENHFTPSDFKHKSLMELLPSIFFNRPHDPMQLAAC